MPEGPEVRVVADVIENFIDQRFLFAKVVENTNKIHRFSKKPITNFEKISQEFVIQNVETKGKLIGIKILNDRNEVIYILNTLGMSGTWSRNQSSNVHARVSFFTERDDLTFIDPRCFGTIRIVNQDNYDKAFKKIGHDFLKSKMDDDKWIKMKNHKLIKDLQIGEALMSQKLFSGIGNIYKSEIIYECSLDPRTIVSNVSDEQWMMINLVAHQILVNSYKLNGSTISTFSFDGNQGHNQSNLKIYRKKNVHEGPVEKLEQCGRITWWCPNRVFSNN